MYTNILMSLYISFPACVTCSSGKLSADCLACDCSEAYSVQVKDNNNEMPLINATIAPKYVPNNIMSVSGVNGILSLNDQCSSTLYVIEKSGYVTAEVDGETLKSASTVLLQKVGEETYVYASVHQFSIDF